MCMPLPLSMLSHRWSAATSPAPRQTSVGEGLTGQGRHTDRRGREGLTGQGRADEKEGDHRSPHHIEDHRSCDPWTRPPRMECLQACPK